MTIEPRSGAAPATSPAGAAPVPAPRGGRWGRRRDARAEQVFAEIDRTERQNAWRVACESLDELNHSTRAAAGWTVSTPKLVPVGVDRYRCQLRAGMLPKDLVIHSERLGAALGGRGLRLLGQLSGGWVEFAVLTGPDPLGRPFGFAELLATPEAQAARDAGRVVLGRDDVGALLSAELAELPHALVTGSTTSGKSSFVRAVLAQAATDPCVEVAGVDPALGLFRAWPASPDRVLGLGDVDALVAVLRAEVDRMDARLAELPIMADRLTPGAEHPLRLVVLDELPGIYRVAEEAGKATGAAVRGAVSRLLAEGHKAAFRVWLLAQRGDAKIVGGFERSNLGLTVSLRQDAAGLRMLHGGDDVPPEVLAAQTTAPAGVGLISAPSVPVRRFRSPWLSYPEYVAELRLLNRFR